MVGVGPLIFFGAQRISALFATQNESIQQKHEPMAESLSQAIYGYLLDQTSALQSTASQIESDNDSSIARLNDPGFNAAHLNPRRAPSFMMVKLIGPTGIESSKPLRNPVRAATRMSDALSMPLF